MTVQIQLRHGTAAQWTTANPVLAAGEVGVETDTAKLKIGDGTTAWSALSYFGGSLSGAAGGDLAGTYPNPTVAQAAAAFALPGTVAATFTGSTVDYNAGAVAHIRWNGASAATLHGLVAGVAGALMILENATAAQVLTVPNESATEATAARRVLTPDAQDITLQPGGVLVLRYSATASRWVVIARAFALAAGPDADVTVDAAGASGTAGRGARSGHGHKLVTYSSTPAAPAASGGAGTSGDAPARGSHVHPIPAPNVQVFTAGSGNWTKPAGARYVIVECVGGGGGSGATAATGSGTRAASGAGGGAGYARKTFAASALASTEPYVVGAAGAAGASAGDGGAGGDSTFGAVGYRVTGGGGQGGAGAAATSSAVTQAGGAGGTASGGEINAAGQPGDSGRILAGPATLPIANGGNSIWGGGGLCGAGASGSAPSGGYGGGGGGSTANASDGAHGGAAGAAGVVVVTTLF